MSRTKSPSLLLAAFALAISLFGCSTKTAPDEIMSKSPTGLWVGKTDSGTTVDIESGGTFKLTRAGREMAGTWTDGGKGMMKVSLNGQSFEIPYQRKDLGLQMTLPGENQASYFEQM